MNAPFAPPLLSTCHDRSVFDAAEEEIATWRGRMLHVFARAEQSVSETLLALADAYPKRVPLQRLVGARYDDLATALSPDGVRPYAPGVAALNDFRVHDPLRHALCHGVAEIYVNQRGDWLANYRMIAFNGGRHDHVTQVIVFAQAAAKLESVRKQGSDLNAVLGQVRAVPTLQSV